VNPRTRTTPHSPVYLEPPSEACRDELIAAARRSRAFLGRRARAPTTRAKFAAWLARNAEPNRRCYLIRRRDGGELIGVAALSEIVRGVFHSAYLGYYRFEPWSGRGYMTAGLDLVLREAFRALKLHRLEANIEPDNAPSRALVQRLGFRLEGLSRRYLKIGGRWRDHERWAIVAEEWKPLRAKDTSPGRHGKRERATTTRTTRSSDSSRIETDR